MDGDWFICSTTVGSYNPVLCIRIGDGFVYRQFDYYVLKIEMDFFDVGYRISVYRI